jgi:hypothetical protein
MTRQKARDAALLLPLFGLLLLLPPFVGLMQGVAGFAGVPAIVLYIFVIWAALIAAGILLSGRLRVEQDLQGSTSIEQAGPDADT